MEKIFIGTSGFYYKHWQNKFYPKNIKKNNLLFYYQKSFNTVEINSSFYHIPQPATISNWIKNTTPGFIFSFKAPRAFTHYKRLDPDASSLRLFLERVEPFSSPSPKHLILFQTPGYLQLNLVVLNKLFLFLPKTFLYACEFRNESWFTDETYKVMRKFNASMVLSDSPNKKWPYHNIETANFFYIRLHGSKNLFSSSYSIKELRLYAQLMKNKEKKGMRVFAYFNNDAEANAVKNAKTLSALLN